MHFSLLKVKIHIKKERKKKIFIEMHKINCVKFVCKEMGDGDHSLTELRYISYFATLFLGSITLSLTLLYRFYFGLMHHEPFDENLFESVALLRQCTPER